MRPPRLPWSAVVAMTACGSELILGGDAGPIDAPVIEHDAPADMAAHDMRMPPHDMTRMHDMHVTHDMMPPPHDMMPPPHDMMPPPHDMMPPPPMCGPATLSGADTRDFDGDTTGMAPPGWSVDNGAWSVIADSTAPTGGNVVRGQQMGSNYYPRMMLTSSMYGNFTASVSFKFEEGMDSMGARLKREGGLLLRGDMVGYMADRAHHGADRAYAVRADIGGDAIRIYKMVHGQRYPLSTSTLSGLAEARSIGMDGTMWNTLSATVHGNTIDVSVNGVPALTYTDMDSPVDVFTDPAMTMYGLDGPFPSFPCPGTVGLWVEGSAIGHFDHLVLTPGAP